MKRFSGASAGSSVGRGGRVLAALAALLMVLFVAAGHAIASTYYVDAARPDDTGGGLSWADAKQTIQAAINASVVGDTILVKYGVYPITSAILIDSVRLLTSDDGTHDSWDSAVHDSSLCVVSQTAVRRVFTITGATPILMTRLRGFMITGGRATSESPGALYGGGIYVGLDADAVIEHCWVTDNRATTSSNGYGGGIAVRNAGTQVTIRYSRIDNNVGSTSWVGAGGGLYFEDAALCRVYGNTIVNNVASSARIGYGGGIDTDNTDLLIWSNTISYNVGSGPSAVGGDGGGISVYGGTVKIWNNVITYNHACERPGYGGDGGGINIAGTIYGDSIIVFDNPAISYNIASTAGSGNGGGIACQGPYAWMYGNTIVGNVASASTYAGKGGGVAIYSFSGITLRDNVITDNTASLHGVGSGGGVYASTAQKIERNIIAFNTASAAGDGYGGGLWTASASGGKVANNTFYRNANTVVYGAAGTGSGWHHDAAGFPAVRNNIFAGHDVVHSDSTGAHSNVAGTIWYNCFHNNPGGDYSANLTSSEEHLADPRLGDPDNGDFSLMYDSPCIEEGDPTYPVPENGAWVVDIGAIEYTGTRHWRAVTGAGELLFGGQVKAKVNVTTAGGLSEIDMFVYPGETHPMAPVSVARWFHVDHVGTGMTFDLTLTYRDEELNGRAEDSLSVWRWYGTGWDGPKSPSATDLVKNTIAVPGQTAFSDWILTDEWGPTHIRDVPGRFHLSANYPNPFNPATTITYELARPCHVRIDVYDAAGHLVRVLVDSYMGSGPHRLEWNGLDRRGVPAASGVYFCRLRTEGFEQARKMVLVR